MLPKISEVASPELPPSHGMTSSFTSMNKRANVVADF
jgi:hypothetical protein